MSKPNSIPQERSLQLHFHGTGNGGSLIMGSSAATLDLAGAPLLTIDCGPGTLTAFHNQYQQLPDALFITHGHLDHIADLEILQVRIKLQQKAPVPLFVPLEVIPVLHQRLACYPGAMAEGEHNFWQSFQLMPVTDSFHFKGMEFRVYPARHHGPGSCFSLHLPGVFYYSADTRPVPEILHHRLSGTEMIFHDCAPISNPSHTGLEDLEREYQPAVRERLVLYHYPDENSGDQMRAAGYQVARPGDSFLLESRKPLSE